MKTRSNNSRSTIETLEGRSMMSAVAYADFNKDGLMDMAALTNPTTITVSLAQADGYPMNIAMTLDLYSHVMADMQRHDADADPAQRDAAGHGRRLGVLTVYAARAPILA